MRTITFRFFKLFKSNKGLIEPISTFVLIVVLAVGAVFSSNLVSQRTSQISQASCPEGQQSCTDDPYGEPCGDKNTGVKVCHKKGCSKDGQGGVDCSWGPGSYCDACVMPTPETPTPPVIPESERCKREYCDRKDGNGCLQGHFVGNDCCFHTELDCEKKCSVCGVTPQPTPTLAPGTRPPVPTPDAGGELKCPCKPQSYCDPATGYWCGNDCRLHPGSDEDKKECGPRPTLRQVTPIRLPTPTAVPTIIGASCQELCIRQGYYTSACMRNVSLFQYSCSNDSTECFYDLASFDSQDCKNLDGVCVCGSSWRCNDEEVKNHPGCNSCCQKTPTPTLTPAPDTTPTLTPTSTSTPVPTSTPTPTPIPTNTPTPPSNLPATCEEACGGGAGAIAMCNNSAEGASCGENTDGSEYCVFSEKRETRQPRCERCICTRRYECGDASAPGECKCCPQWTGKTCHLFYNMVCNLGDLTFTSCKACPEGSSCESASPGMANCEPKSTTAVADTLSTFSGHGEASSPAKNAKITLKDPDGKKFVVKTDENGDYTITVPTDRIYDVAIESTGYKTLVFKWDSKMGLDYLMNFKLIKKDKAESGNFEIEEATKDRLLVGWNLISLPVKPKKQMTASGLLAEINRSGGLAVSVSRWQDGRWETYLAGLDKNDFAIEVGQAYFVENFNETQFKIEGEEITQPQTLDLKPGWNAIGLPKTSSCPTSSCSAKAVMNLIDKQSADSARIFGQFESGLWGTLAKEKEQFYGWDFVIKSNAGYFVKVNKPLQLLP